MRLTFTLWESEPEVAVMVIWEAAGVGLPDPGEEGGGVDDAGVVGLPPPLQPVIAPRLRMQTIARIEPRRYLLLLRTPAKPRRLNGSRPASIACAPCRRAAE